MVGDADAGRYGHMEKGEGKRPASTEGFKMLCEKYGVDFRVEEGLAAIVPGDEKLLLIEGLETPS